VNSLLDLHYLPCIEYFSLIFKSDTITIEKNEYYEKQTYRNRCHINTAQGIGKLIVPLTSKHGNVPITEVRIDHSQKWLNNHWRAIESAYRNAPFFEHYAEELHQSLFRRNDFLYDMNFELLTMCLKWLACKIPIHESVAYEKTPDSAVHDKRNHIRAKISAEAKNNFTVIPYQQVFGKTFVNNLSIIDLVFCEGPNARNIVRASGTPEHFKV